MAMPTDIGIIDLMLERPPTAAERDRWVLEAEPYATIPSEILGTDEYRARIAD